MTTTGARGSGSGHFEGQPEGSNPSRPASLLLEVCAMAAFLLALALL